MLPIAPKAPAPAAPAAHPAWAPSPPPPRRLAWPNQQAFEEEAKSRAQSRCNDALERFYRARGETVTFARTLVAEPSWPMHPGILHPELQASCMRRFNEGWVRLGRKQARADTLWRDYIAQGAIAAELISLLETQAPPPRMAYLVGGLEAYLALPDVSQAAGRDPQGLAVQNVPLARGRDKLGRLFVAISYERTVPPLGQGVVVLYQATADPQTAWLMANPQKFVPPGKIWRGALAPTFPSMTGRGALVGGPDSQAMFTALHAFIAEGQLGPYRLMAAPGPNGVHAL